MHILHAFQRQHLNSLFGTVVAMLSVSPWVWEMYLINWKREKRAGLLFHQKSPLYMSWMPSLVRACVTYLVCQRVPWRSYHELCFKSWVV
mmetsp:Transcript_101815/g.141458  ORF Transcript_101815/g.141458 Transcript_101815/m.141458 type:complete len:90 (+) Transcript_101815:234-503(+)